MYLSEEAFVLLYKALIRAQLEYANLVCNPYRMGLTKDLEKVQMRATKLVITIKHLKYTEIKISQIKITNIKVQVHSCGHY